MMGFKLDIASLANQGSIDYTTLMQALRHYAKPRDYVTRLLKSGDLIRVKKGLYILGEQHRTQLVQSEVLANQIYGPSYISLEYALSFYGMIPERVFHVTSMTTQRNKHFITPLGHFYYFHLHPSVYCIGINLHPTLNAKANFLIASKEKALCDLIVRQSHLHTLAELNSYLIENLRIEKQALVGLEQEKLNHILYAYKNKKLDWLLRLIKEA